MEKKERTSGKSMRKKGKEIEIVLDGGIVTNRRSLTERDW